MRARLVALALLAGACGPFGGVQSGASLCALVPEDEVVAALGVVVVEVAPVAGDHPSCRWSGASGPDGLPRTLSADLWRNGALRRSAPGMSGTAFFESELQRLERDFTRTRVLGGLGEAAVYGFGDITEERFTGGIIVRDEGDVLSLRIAGADPAAFEDVARRIAAAM
ncbi:MAG: hypothetical protein NW200_08650 [Hyphomonadaceae bacterium]|nr:hypothetical protein [Hyphomonadaceae bacterium]